MEYLKELATVGCLGWSIIICLAMTRVYDPANGKCFTDNPIFIERLIMVISIILIACVGVFMGFTSYRRKKKAVKENTGVSALWNNFFNQFYAGWVLSAGIGLVIAFVSGSIFGESKQKNAMVLISIVNFSIWSYVYNNFINSICAFLGSFSPDIDSLLKSNGWRQMFTQGANSVLIIVVLAASRYISEDINENPAMCVVLLITFVLECFLLGYFIMLYKHIHQNSYSLITAVLQDDGVVSVNSTCGNTRASGKPRPTSGHLSIFNLEADEELTYSSKYFQIHRLISLLKMLTTALYLECALTAVLILVVFAGDYFGNLYLYFFLKLMVVVFPFLYLLVYRYARKFGSPIDALEVARDYCIVFMFCASLITMGLMGSHRGCRRLVQLGTDEQKRDMGAQFTYAFLKTNALQSTLSFGMAILTSPGVGTWIKLPIYLKFLMMPTLWPTPHAIFCLHQAFGINMMFSGAAHGFVWIVLIASGIIDVWTSNGGRVIALCTGLTMVLICVKLIWPPGHLFPFQVENSYLKRLETFLKDSKYGHWHVYLATANVVIYCFHGSWALPTFKAAPYFLFTAVSYLILRIVHPATNQFIARLLGWDSLELLEVNCKPLRTRGVNQVDLIVRPPEKDKVRLYKDSACDIIMLRNIDTMNRFLYDTVHWYSVAGVHLLETGDKEDPYHVQVRLLISYSRRNDTMAAVMQRQGKAENQPAEDTSIKMQMGALIKSAVEEALYGPNIIAVGWDSGASSFCSLLKTRAAMRKKLKAVSASQNSDFVDLCIIWLPFSNVALKQPKATDIITTIKETTAFQDYMVENGGGSSVKYVFITSGVPPEWTPEEECISHKNSGLESAVAETLGVQRLISDSNDGWKVAKSVIPAEIEQEIKVKVEASPEVLARVQKAESDWHTSRDEVLKVRNLAGSGLHAVLKLSIVSCPQSSGINVGLSNRNDVSRIVALNDECEFQLNRGDDFVDIKITTAQATEDLFRLNLSTIANGNKVSVELVAETRSLSDAEGADSSAIELSSRGTEGGNSHPTISNPRDSTASSPSLVGRLLGAGAPPKVKVQVLLESIETLVQKSEEKFQSAGKQFEICSTEAEPKTISKTVKVPNPAYTAPVAVDISTVSPMFTAAGGGPNVGSDGQAKKLTEKPNTLFSVNLRAAPGDLMLSKMATVVQCQAREESWIPMRHALGSTWKEFKGQLNRRISNTLRWLYSDEGPDYTTLYVTEHRSDVGLLREFKYDTIYNEVNQALISEMLKYCKNSVEYMANEVDNDGDPIHSSTISCHVLYSGDYSSTKKDSLEGVCRAVVKQERTHRSPAYIHFVSDG